MQRHHVIIIGAVVLLVGGSVWLQTKPGDSKSLGGRATFLRDQLLGRRGADFHAARPCDLDPRAKCGPNGEVVMVDPATQLTAALSGGGGGGGDDGAGMTAQEAAKAGRAD